MVEREATEVEINTGETVTSIKGFDANFRCLNYQFDIGGTHECSGEIVVCANGFHGIEGHPLEVFQYYPPATSRYAIVTQSGQIARDSDGSKIASAKITVEAELYLPELIDRAIKWTFDRTKWNEGSVATGNNEGATASGPYGAATASGECGAAIASGEYGAATASGMRGAATASGMRGAATASGPYGAAIASGPYGAAIASGMCGAATASGPYGAAIASGECGAAIASGEYGAATASGWRGAATASGMRGAATASSMCGAATASGPYGAATASGFNGRVSGCRGSALFLTRRDPSSGEITHVWAGVAGRDGIKPMVWYTLGGDGQPMEYKPESI